MISSFILIVLVSAYEVEEDCRRYRLKAIAFLCFAVASFIAAYILKTL